ncbi:MAG TPA: HisA/HisF-related TIM barrel protein [Vitreimonas sp.]|nr:HisA/HisF-related TIM barrel protein [Vitreimonas sp.]
MLVIPAIDLQGGRSRVVFWPGVSAGVGAPTDRPDVIAARLVEQGARLIHLVDFDGAQLRRPASLEAIGSVAARVAVPLQVAGGLESADAVRLVFAAGATRAVLGMEAVEQPAMISECLAVAGDWLAVGLDPRPERLAAFPWRRPAAPTLPGLVAELTGLGVRRVVLAHGGAQPDAALLDSLVRAYDVEVLVAGGAADIAGIRRLRDAGVAGVILGEALLSGAIDYSAAVEAAA